MRELSKEFENKKIDYDKLLAYGFDHNYYYETQIGEGQFKVIIELGKEKKVSKVIDLVYGEEYTLVDVVGASGNFVGKLREEYEKVLYDIIKKCTTSNLFKNKQTKEIIQHVKEKYQDELEFLWKSSPNNAIWRNKENQKWYAVLLTIPAQRLGMDSLEQIEIIDLRYPKGKTSDIIDNERIYAGYHMNKKSWITIVLDNRMETKKIIELLDNSYLLSLNK